jgi:hypothetical protein
MGKSDHKAISTVSKMQPSTTTRLVRPAAIIADE